MGVDDLDVHFDLVRGVERGVIRIPWECDRPVRGPHGVSVSHRNWHWVSRAGQAP